LPTERELRLASHARLPTIARSAKVGAPQ
jgi:hypothetical protein